LPSDESVPAAASPSWATLLAGNTLFWLAYSLASTATRVPSVSAPLAEWLQAWTLTTPQWVTGLLFTPLVVVMARRIPLDGTAWKRNATAHVLGAAGLTLGGLALQQGLYFALHPAYAARITWWASYTSVVADMALLCLMLYAGGVGIYHAWAARQDDYARIDAAAYDPAFWRDHPVLARTPTDRAAIASFERTGAFGRLTDMLE
jgi:hypothetical protein